MASLAPETNWQALADLTRLAAWMDSRDLGRGPIEDVRLLAGGTQNLILQFRRGDARYVLRRPSGHPRANADETMRREARVLGALRDTEVRHPKLIAACADPAVLGTAFYLMAPVDGVNVANGLPALHASDPRLRRKMGFEMVDAILALGAVDHVAVGLADFGKAEGFLARQAPRWRRQLESYKACAGWPGPAVLPEVEAVGDWIEAHCPPSFAPGILHGDFHIANVMFRRDGPELAAIIDWELATIGDPLLDLTWLLATWPQPDGSRRSEEPILPWDGFPRAEDLVERYAAGSWRDMSQLHWYKVLACFKLGIILEGSHARACAGQAPVDIGRRFHASAADLLRQAGRWIESS